MGFWCVSYLTIIWVISNSKRDLAGTSIAWNFALYKTINLSSRSDTMTVTVVQIQWNYPAIDSDLTSWWPLSKAEPTVVRSLKSCWKTHSHLQDSRRSYCMDGHLVRRCNWTLFLWWYVDWLKLSHDVEQLILSNRLWFIGSGVDSFYKQPIFRDLLDNESIFFMQESIPLH